MGIPLDSGLREAVVGRIEQNGGKVVIHPGTKTGDFGVVARRDERSKRSPKFTVLRRERIANGGAVNVSDTTFTRYAEEATFSDILGRDLTQDQTIQEAYETLSKVLE